MYEKIADEIVDSWVPNVEVEQDADRRVGILFTAREWRLIHRAVSSMAQALSADKPAYDVLLVKIYHVLNDGR